MALTGLEQTFWFLRNECTPLIPLSTLWDNCRAPLGTYAGNGVMNAWWPLSGQWGISICIPLNIWQRSAQWTYNVDGISGVIFQFITARLKILQLPTSFWKIWFVQVLVQRHKTFTGSGSLIMLSTLQYPTTLNITYMYTINYKRYHPRSSSKLMKIVSL